MQIPCDHGFAVSVDTDKILRGIAERCDTALKS